MDPLGLSTLRGTKSMLSTPKRYNKHPRPFYMGGSLPLDAHHRDKCQGDDLIVERFYFDLYLQIANEDYFNFNLIDAL